MRKEVLLAIIAGIVFGIILAFGIWRANSALKNGSNEPLNEQVQASPTPPAEFNIALAAPDNFDVITSSPVIIEGVTAPLSFISISADENDYLSQANESGAFDAEIELTGGVNQILITAFNESGQKVEEKLLLVYSTQFLE